MIEQTKFIELLEQYGIDGRKLIDTNQNVLEYAEYHNAEAIIRFLQKKGVQNKNIKKCPSILSMVPVEIIEKNYEFLTKETILKHKDIEDTLSILISEPEELKNIYYYILKKYGEKILKDCLTILTGNYQNMKEITEYLEDTIGLEIVKEIGLSFLTRTTKEEIEKILFIPEFQYNQKTKKYNRKLLGASTFQRSYKEIKKILELPFWKNDKFKWLLTPNIWRKTAKQIQEILELEYWNQKQYFSLLTSTIWLKDKEQIEEIIKLDYWENKLFKPLLTSTIWQRNTKQIQEVLELPYWQEEKFQFLLTSTIWHKDASQIKEILELSYWQDKKYLPLLKPSIWTKTADQIKEILELEYWQDPIYIPLFTPTIWNKNATQIKEILELPYWKEKKFQPLLTANIWIKNKFQIEEVLNLEYWKEEKYQSLLIPSLWSKNANQIMDNIEVCFNNGLEEYANNPNIIFRNNAMLLQAKINFLNYHGISLYNKNGRINGLFGMNDIKMKKKYGINKKELVRDYLNIERGLCYVL